MSGTSFGIVSVGTLVVGGLVLLVALASLSWRGRSRRARPVVFGGLLVLMFLLGISLMAVNRQQTRRAQAMQHLQEAKLRLQTEQNRVKAEIELPKLNDVLASHAGQHVIATMPSEMIIDAGDGANAMVVVDGVFADEPVVVTCSPDTGGPWVVKRQGVCWGGWLGRFPPGSIASYLSHVGAFAALLILAYLFLDARRHGRYTWPLRLSTVVLFVGLCVVLR